MFDVAYRRWFSMDPDLAKLSMLRNQLEQRGITDRGVLDAMQRIPREKFIASQYLDEAYADRALDIDCGQTISQPYMVALMTQALELSPRERVLEIGTGSGYQTAVLASLADYVVSIERHAELSRQAKQRLEELGFGNVRLVVGDGIHGWIEEAPYDRIVVTAAAALVPTALVDQLCEGGILVIPLGDRDGQSLESIQKRGGRLHSTSLTTCRFVPFVGAQDEGT